MERFTLAPTTREIIVNRASDAADDLFSYGPETKAQARSLGHLYVVGHTDQESETVGYLVSLVAAMAKREYFATQPAGDAKEAFARMLRKVNEVVEEFFKTNEVGVNVGIFAVAGNTMYVSRLGKFRILLSRTDKVIDVLKDVSQFTKEVVQKKRFSSIISGPVQAQDRLLAYFPQVAITRRERVIKAGMATDSPDELDARIAEFGKKSASFAASLLMIDIDQVPAEPEPDVAPPADPTATPRLAWAPRQGGPVARKTAAVDAEPGPASEEGSPSDGVWDDTDNETPNIIPAEFSHRRRGTSVTRVADSLRRIRLGSLGKAAFLMVIAVAVIGGALVFKSTLFPNEVDTELQATLNNATDTLVQVQAYIEEGHRSTARATVLDQLDSLKAIVDINQNEDAENLYVSYVGVLNDIDRANPAQVTLVGTVPADEGTVLMGAVASGSDTLWVLADAPDGIGQVLITVNEGVVADSVALEHNADILIPAPPSVLLANTDAQAITVFDAPSGEVILPTPDRILSVDWFLDYAYVLTTSGIMKVSDLDTKKPVSKQWLSDVSELESNAKHIAVDGDVWTLSSDGTLSNYFRGAKVSDTQLPLAISSSNKLLTDEDMPFLYITDTHLKRVHVIDKENVQLIQTVTVDTEQEVRDFVMTGDYGILMLASDGKIWRVE